MKEELELLNEDVWETICEGMDGFKRLEQKITGKWRHGTEEEIIFENGKSGKLYKSCYRLGTDDMSTFEDCNFGGGANFKEFRRPQTEEKQKELQIIPETVAGQTNCHITFMDSLTVTNHEQMETAIAALKDGRKLKKKFSDLWGEHTKLAHAAWKSLTEKRAKYTKPFEEAEKRLTWKVNAYEQDLSRLRREEDERLRIKAHRAQLVEEARLKEIREKEEATFLAEKKRLDAELEKAAENNDEAKFEEVSMKQEEVRKEDFQTAPVSVPETTYVPTAAPEKIAGYSHRQKWEAVVVSPMELLKAIVAGHVSIKAIKFDQSYLNSRARQDKKNLRIPGVKAQDVGGIAIRQ